MLQSSYSETTPTTHSLVTAYRDLVHHSTAEVLVTPGTDEDAYLAAGKRVVDLSDKVLAVWNGAPAQGRGTADIVFMRKKRVRPPF